MAQREQAAFAALFRRHGPMVLGVCRRVLGHEQDAEDAFQAAFLTLAHKADSIRKHESLGSWLHGVAYHIADKLRAKDARRMIHERKALSRPPIDPAEDAVWREIRCRLDSELARLPEQCRSPLVLCYLEGKTQDEAARQLGWSLSRLRRRLNRARRLLAHRLTRRGLTLPAALTASLLIESSATAAVPPLLAAGTIRAGMALVKGQAIATVASASIAALVESSGQALAASKLKWSFALLLAVCAVAGGARTHQTLPSKSAPLPTPSARKASKDKRTEIKGCVLGPDGKPFSGAHLILLPNSNPKKADVSAHATTDKEGRFRFAVPSAGFAPQGKAKIVATAKGLGLDWIDVNTKDKSIEITLRLVADDAPIIGRVLDLEGKPIAGVTVQIRSVRKQADGSDLASWVDRNVKSEGVLNSELGTMKLLQPAGLDVPAMVTSGVDGRFRLIGFGRERVLRLAIRGPAIADADFFAATRTGPAKGWISGEFGLYGARFDYVIAPCKPVVGTVRDKRTGKPLAGITVAASDESRWCETKTDNQGRYRIVGLAKSKQYDVGAGGMPYINCPKNEIPDTPGLEPLTVDFALDRGVAMRGRLLDKLTGKPVRGHIYYRPQPDNPHIKDFTDLNKGGISPYNPGDTAADGSFTVVAIPGPGWLGAQANDVNRFVQAADGGDQYHAEIRINPREDDPKSTTCEIALEPANVLKGLVVGPDDRPLAGVYAAGRLPVIFPDLFSQEKLETASFQVGGMKAGHPRTLVFLHPERKLGKVLKLQGDEKKDLRVRLKPLDAALTGRILDAKGRPWPSLKVMVFASGRGDTTYPPEFHWGHSAWQKLGIHSTTTGSDGRFRVAELMPGLKYILWAKEKDAPPGPPFAYRDGDSVVTIDPGKTKDLGDLKSKLTPEK